MSSPKHKKPELERREPIRNFSGVFGSPQNRGASGGAPGIGAPPSPADAVFRGVDMGYRVIEQYMRQGQAFARAGWPPRVPGGGPAWIRRSSRRRCTNMPPTSPGSGWSMRKRSSRLHPRPPRPVRHGPLPWPPMWVVSTSVNHPNPRPARRPRLRARRRSRSRRFAYRSTSCRAGASRSPST